MRLRKTQGTYKLIFNLYAFRNSLHGSTTSTTCYAWLSICPCRHWRTNTFLIPIHVYNSSFTTASLCYLALLDSLSVTKAPSSILKTLIISSKKCLFYMYSFRPHIIKLTHALKALYAHFSTSFDADASTMHYSLCLNFLLAPLQPTTTATAAQSVRHPSSYSLDTI